MRMSDPVDAGAMKVSEAATAAADVALPPSKDANTAAKPEAPDQQQRTPNNSNKDTQPAKHPKSNTRLKLVRSLAVCDESFPCPFPEPSARPQQDGFVLQPLEKEERASQDPAEKEADKPERSHRKMLSRDSSQDYTDSTGIDLHEFLVNTLKGNPRDRIMLLKLEQDILDFISNNESQKRKFPPMTSYHRMLLHRVAAYFGMDHNVDPSGKSVVINKTPNTRIPDQKFSEHIKDDRADDFQKRYILKRDNSSFDRDDGTIRMRLKADKRSKSMEEREEEYQRARERIFAHDGDHFILERSAHDEDTRMSTQQRRQMFRLRAGQSGASRQSSSETDTPAARHGEPRPWSSTDSSDSSNRPAPRPAITKASSFSGISPGLARGDSTASSGRSTGRLSKTGSESCSSVGSSSSSLSRPQLPLLPAPASSRPGAGLPLPPPPLTDRRGPTGRPDAAKGGAPPLPPTDAASYYLLPLDASGIPPGSVLFNPHTGKPFMHPDGSAIVYSPAGIAAAASRIPQQGKATQQPISAAPQQTTNHLHSQQICPPLQPPSEPVHNPTVSYPLPPPPPPLPPPPQFLPVCPNQHYTVPDALNAQFSHMTLAQQPTPTDGGVHAAPDGRHYPSVYHPQLLQGAPAQQLAGYVVTGPPAPAAPPHPAVLQGAGPASNHAYPAAAATQLAMLNQHHAYIQQPVQQVSTCYCHHPHSSSSSSSSSTQQQHYYQRPPVSVLPYNCPQSQNLPQQQAHQATMPNPASGYPAVVGVPPLPPTANLALAGNQQSNMGNPMQGVMVQYPPMQQYQVSVPQQTYQQPVLVSCQPGGQGGAAASVQPCYGLLPANQHATMSSTLSFLPAPMLEQLSFSHPPPPCVSQQHPGQQYAGLLPAGPGSGGGGAAMVMLQMTAAPCQQPRTASPCPRKPPGHKPPAPEHQRVPRRPLELAPPPLPPPDSAQSSLPSSPALTPSPGQPPPGVKAIPVMAPPPHHPLPTAFCHSGPGEAAHYSLLGRPLQYKASIRPPLIHAAHMVAKHQGALGVWRSGKKAGRKSLSSNLS